MTKVATRFPDFNQLFPKGRAIQSSAIREILKVTGASGSHFRWRLAFIGDVPVTEMLSAFDRVLTAKGREALQYSTTEGICPFARMDRRARQTPTRRSRRMKC